MDALYVAEIVACGAVVLSGCARFLKNAFIIRNHQPNIRASRILSKPNVAKKALRAFANKKCNQPKSREVSEEPGGSQTCRCVFDVGRAQLSVQFNQKFVATACRDMALKYIVPKELVLGAPRVQKKVRPGRAHSVKAPIRLTMQTPDQALSFKSVYNATRESRIHDRSLGERTDSEPFISLRGVSKTRSTPKFLN
jgi:hypothetical protein